MRNDEDYRYRSEKLRQKEPVGVQKKRRVQQLSPPLQRLYTNSFFPKQYDLKTLQKKRRPIGVQDNEKEKHLLNFKDHFGITIDQFNSLPKWRQQEKKKELDLFG